MNGRCPMCGNDMDPSRCLCPFASRCDVLCCPHCHYKIPGESRLTRFLRRVLCVRSEEVRLPPENESPSQ